MPNEHSMQIIRQIKNNKQIQLFLFLAVAVFTYYFVKSILISTPLFHSIEVYYAKILVSTLNILADNYNVDASNSLIRNNEITFSFGLILVIKYYVITFIVLFVFPRQIKKTILVFILSAVAYFVLTNLRILIETYFPPQFQSSSVQFVIGLRYLLMYNIIRYKTGLHALTQQLYDKINQKISETFYFSFHVLLSFIALLPAITGLFDWFLVGKWNFFVEYLTKIILNISDLLLSTIGYESAYVVGKFIHLGNYWLFLDSNCLGVGLMFVFSALILSIRSPFVNRFLFVLMGLGFILVMNAFRIVIILLYIFTNQIPSSLIEDYHNKSNNVFYVLVFIIIFSYINWFQYLSLSKTKK